MRNRRKRNLAKKGINFSRTIRVNLQNGGKLLKIIPTRKYSKKPRLVVITDVSPSTIHATRLFLSILSAIKDVFEDIQFYEFIGSCIDVTTEFKRANSVPEAIDAVVDAWNKVRWGKESSDYQQAFADFLKVSNGKITKRHKIVILADCRDWLGGWKNGKPISVKHLQTMKELVGGIWVFNPEEKKFWDRGDSIVSHMQETGVQVIESVTLNQLAKNIEAYLL